MAKDYDRTLLQQLAKKVVDGTASAEEKIFLLEYYNSFDKEPNTADLLSAEETNILRQEIKNPLLTQIETPSAIVIPFYKKRSVQLLTGVAVAAAMIVSASTAYLFNDTKKTEAPVKAQITIKDVPAGSNKAVLTLASGKQIVLTGAANGDLAKDNNALIRKTADGEIVYTGDAGNATAIAYNTMSTPRGGQYHLVLTDSTQVWLNAASTITYPTRFVGDARRVQITGEVYFEVAHDSSKPFFVTCGSQTVKVLGTRFNVSGYSDEPEIRTTLLEGSVKISATDKADVAAVLKPGQQSQIDRSVSKISVRQVDVNEAIAWHKDLFVFNNEDLKSIMRKVSRWYNLDVTYDGEMPGIQLYGVVSRSKPISAVIHALEATSNLQFTLEKGKIVVASKI